MAQLWYTYFLVVKSVFSRVEILLTHQAIHISHNKFFHLQDLNPMPGLGKVN